MTTLYMVRSNPVEGKEDEFNRWYSDVHLPGAANRRLSESTTLSPYRATNAAAIPWLSGHL